MNNYFKFKQFTINQDKCAMKVGTDGVLLGVWGNIPSDGRSARLLDIGCGTGLISIIAAQRAENILIDGIDIEPNAVRQSIENGNKSPWSSRLNFFNSSLQDFNTDYKYDYILSNPPYFINSLKNEIDSRAIARHSDTLSYFDLAENVDRLLSEDGIFSTIFPYVEASIFIVEASKKLLYCNRRMDIRGREGGAIKRVMLQFSRKKGDFITEELTIEKNERHSYSSKYIELTKDLYLNF